MNNNFYNLGVFCGANPNVDQHYIDEAYLIGKLLASNSVNVVYGGSKFGTMGAVANGALDAKGFVTGVFPESVLLKDEEVHTGLSKLIFADDMHQRKLTMCNLSDGFLILPGGFGTMDETFEILTWKCLKIIDKPIIIYNYNGYYNILIQLIDSFITTNFTSLKVREKFTVVTDRQHILMTLSSIKLCKSA